MPRGIPSTTAGKGSSSPSVHSLTAIRASDCLPLAVSSTLPNAGFRWTPSFKSLSVSSDILSCLATQCSDPVRVNWRDMQTEELGSVYEGLLELTPRLADTGPRPQLRRGLETKGNERKTSGSYYTPDALVQTLLDSALDPVLDRFESESSGFNSPMMPPLISSPSPSSIRLAVRDTSCSPLPDASLLVSLAYAQTVCLTAGLPSRPARCSPPLHLWC